LSKTLGLHYAPPSSLDISQIHGIGDHNGILAKRIVDNIIFAEHRYIDDSGCAIPLSSTIRRYQAIAEKLDQSLAKEDKYHKCDLRFQVRNILEQMIERLNAPEETNYISSSWISPFRRLLPRSLRP
jgi:hypothetical protein